MSARRWQHLDSGRKPAGDCGQPAGGSRQEAGCPSPEAASAEEQRLSAEAGGDTGQLLHRSPAVQLLRGLSPALAEAAAHYYLRDFAACVECIRAVDSAIPGARRLLGLALGRLSESAAAVEALSAALREAPGDMALRASLLSAELRAGGDPEPIPDATGPAAELMAAAEWRGAARHLAAGRAAEAARFFRSAAGRFATASPAEVLGERVGACYVGEVVALLAAGRAEEAQQAFGRLPGKPSVSAGVIALARKVYELAEELRALPVDERLEAAAELPGLVLNARMHVGFYDQEAPVSICWENLPG